MVEVELTELYEYEKKKIAIMLIADTLNDLEKKDIEYQQRIVEIKKAEKKDKPSTDTDTKKTETKASKPEEKAKSKTKDKKKTA